MYDEIGYSQRKNKKYYVKINNKIIHFGDKQYEDFLIHNDKQR